MRLAKRVKVWLNGKKTHAAAIGTMIAVLWLYHHNDATAKDVIEAVGAALSLMFLRHGLAKSANQQQTAADIVRALRDEIANGDGGGQPAAPQPPPLPPAPAQPPPNVESTKP